MGSGGSKMREFDEFQSSLNGIRSEALQLQGKKPSELADADWNSLRNVFCGIRCMASGTWLRGQLKSACALTSEPDSAR